MGEIRQRRTEAAMQFSRQAKSWREEAPKALSRTDLRPYLWLCAADPCSRIATSTEGVMNCGQQEKRGLRWEERQ
jgi:hypothetical protein